VVIKLDLANRGELIKPSLENKDKLEAKSSPFIGLYNFEFLNLRSLLVEEYNSSCLFSKEESA